MFHVALAIKFAVIMQHIKSPSVSLALVLAR